MGQFEIELLLWTRSVALNLMIFPRVRMHYDLFKLY
jgi:hypothetical protein